MQGYLYIQFGCQKKKKKERAQSLLIMKSSNKEPNPF